MRITFYRKGYSNNSSSAHSLIFTSFKKEVADMSNESQNFGWNAFICSSKSDKINYFECIIRNSFIQTYNLDYDNKLYNIDDIRFGDRYDEYIKRCDDNNTFIYKHFLELYFPEIHRECSSFSSNIDHQSMLSLPLNRDGNNINIDFAQHLYKEFVRNGWYIFGGNDNCSNPKAEPFYDEPYFNEFKEIWIYLKRFPQEILCVKDYKTNEFVLSSPAGLLKILF